MRGNLPLIAQLPMLRDGSELRANRLKNNLDACVFQGRCSNIVV
jgi:hypothetical protein